MGGFYGCDDSYSGECAVIPPPAKPPSHPGPRPTPNHPDWARIPCQACQGSGEGAGQACRHCDGHGFGYLALEELPDQGQQHPLQAKFDKALELSRELTNLSRSSEPISDLHMKPTKFGPCPSCQKEVPFWGMAPDLCCDCRTREYYGRL